MPGMGGSTRATSATNWPCACRRDEGIPAPEFVHVLNYDDISDYMHRVPGPWVLKPRSRPAHGHPQGQQRRGVVADPTNWRPPIASCWRSSYRATFPTLTRRLEQEGALHRVQQIRVATHGRLPGRRRLRITGDLPYHARAGARTRRSTAKSSPPWAWCAASRTPSSSAEADGSSTSWRSRPVSAAPTSTSCWSMPPGINLWREWAAGTGAPCGQEGVSVSPPTHGYAGLVVSLAPALARHLRLQRPLVWRLQKSTTSASSPVARP